MRIAIARMALAVGALLAASPSAVAGDAAAGRVKSAPCVVCHGRDGIGTNPMVPHIAGQSEQYLAKQLIDFRAGRREDPQMTIIAHDLSDSDIANLAAWYASIEFTVSVPGE